MLICFLAVFRMIIYLLKCDHTKTIQVHLPFRTLSNRYWSWKWIAFKVLDHNFHCFFSLFQTSSQSCSIHVCCCKVIYQPQTLWEVFQEHDLKRTRRSACRPGPASFIQRALNPQRCPLNFASPGCSSMLTRSA